jgi:sporulation protein YlmC with PRC-barrel domain
MDDTLDVAQSLLDRLIVDIKGEPLGRVDDVEFTSTDDRSPPRLTALLCGPLALGPRLSQRWGATWMGIGRRLRSVPSDEPVRIPWALVTALGPGEVRLNITEAEAHTLALEEWTRKHVTDLIPGGQP